MSSLQQYFDSELERDLGNIEADLLLDFLTREVGAYFYNRGLYDAQALLSSRVDALSEAIYELEQPTGRR